MSDESESGVVPSDDEDPQISVALTQEFRGPLPHPDILARYDEVAAGAAERIISMTEEQQRHRMGMERGMLGLAQSRQRAEAIGQYASLVVVAASAIVAIITAITDPSWVIGPIGSPALIWTALWALRSMRKPESEEEDSE